MSPSPRLRPSLSITMPLHDFPYSPVQLPPKTPDQSLADDQQHSSTVQPPPRPQRDTYPTYKVRRKRRSDIPQIPEMPDISIDMEPIIPTIETSEVASEAGSPVFQPTPTALGFLSPMPSLSRAITPPRTPAAQASPNITPVDSFTNEWDLINETRGKRHAFERSGSVSSIFSDSSVSSRGSSGSSVPHGGSNGSPVSEATDPFMDDDRHEKSQLSPVDEGTPSAKRVKRSRDVRWTAEMDQHLEATYVRYLQDPRVTPFKTLPGVAPPLGVCSRVASKARRTWSQHRSLTPTPLDTILETGKATTREGSPDTIRPEKSPETASQPKQPQWPRSDSTTRKRLRYIVKHKPALSAYYHRLLHTRSVSPFAGDSSTNARSSQPESSSQERPASPFSSSFSSRDLSISLVTSTAPSMQPEGPLAQLAASQDNDTNSSDKEEEPSLRPSSSSSQRTSRPVDWFQRIGRSQAHQKSQSLQSQLSLSSTSSSNDDGDDFGSQMGVAAPLAAPFMGAGFGSGSARSHLLHSMNTTKSLGRSGFHESKKPSLDSPFELAPSSSSASSHTAPRSLKRRFKSDEEKPRRPVLEDVFGPITSFSTADASTAGSGAAGGSLALSGSGAASSSRPSAAAPGFNHSIDHAGTIRSRGFSLGAVRATDNLTRLFEPPPPLPTLPQLHQQQQQQSSAATATTSRPTLPAVSMLPVSSSFPSFPLSSSSSTTPRPLSSSGLGSGLGSTDEEMSEAPPALTTSFPSQSQQQQHQQQSQQPYFELSSGCRSAPRRLAAEAIPRLGSPFMEISGSNSNTFPRRYAPPSGLNADGSQSGGGSGSRGFQERLRKLAARSQQQQQH